MKYCLTALIILLHVLVGVCIGANVSDMLYRGTADTYQIIELVVFCVLTLSVIALETVIVHAIFEWLEDKE